LQVALATNIGAALISRTTLSPGPLKNVAELVGGVWTSKVIAGASIDGGNSFSGFTSDPAGINNLASVLASATYPNDLRIERFREATVRALAATGQTRVWNLMIDVVAQTGRYPQSAKTVDQFLVEGEQRYWIHLAIDRLTGQIIDKQIEPVKE
jgi:hypothetical protein